MTSTDDPTSTAEDQMLTELEALPGRYAELEREVADRRGALDEKRRALVTALMKTSVARERIASAAGVKTPRLYQIRDGRR